MAEDNDAVAEAVVRVLRGHFDVVGVVTDGRTLIERVDQLQPDLIVSDVGLKGSC